MSPESGLVISGARIDYDGTTLLRDVDLTVAPPDIVALLGPSGSGKSTLLRCIAGVQPLDAGTIRWNGADITHTPAHLRSFGLVFQDALLFPHLNTGANIAYGLRRSGMPRRQISDRVHELLDLIGLPGFADRNVATLSGGEAGRVALARALAPRPRLLLLDEPFAALDRELRDRLVEEVRELLHTLGTPAIHVTHDRQEADRIADRIVRVADGTLRPEDPRGVASDPTLA